MDAILQSKILSTLSSAQFGWLKVRKLKLLGAIEEPRDRIKDELAELEQLGLVDKKVCRYTNTVDVAYRQHPDTNRAIDRNEVLDFLGVRSCRRPTAERIAFELGYSEANIIEMLNTLKADGWVEQTLNAGQAVYGRTKLTTPVIPTNWEEKILEALSLANNGWVGARAIHFLIDATISQTAIREKMTELVAENRVVAKVINKKGGLTYRLPPDKNNPSAYDKPKKVKVQSVVPQMATPRTFQSHRPLKIVIPNYIKDRLNLDASHMSVPDNFSFEE